MPAQLPEEVGSITTAVSERCAASPVTGWERQSKMLILGRGKGTWGKSRQTVGLGQRPRQRDEWWLQGSSPVEGSGGEVMEMAERPAWSQGAVQWPRDPAKLAGVDLISLVDGGDRSRSRRQLLYSAPGPSRWGSPVARWLHWKSCLRSKLFRALWAEHK